MGMSDDEVWFELHMALIDLCAGGALTEEQHDYWNDVIDKGMED